jgi:photosystem I P700 chlorophyll a apoprotein A1
MFFNRTSHMAAAMSLQSLEHLSKGAVTTRSLWSVASRPTQITFSTQAIHASIILAWLSRVCFRGAHWSNFIFWSSNPIEIAPAGNVATPALGQSLFNLGDEGQHLVAGAFFLWLSAGASWPGLKCLGLACSSLVSLAWALWAWASNDIVDGYRFASFQLPQAPFHFASSRKAGTSLLPLSRFAGSRARRMGPLSAAQAALSWAGHLTHACLPQERVLPAGVIHSPFGSQVGSVQGLDVREFTGPAAGAVAAELIAVHHASVGLACAGLAFRGGGASVSSAEAKCASSLLSLAAGLGSLGSLSIAASFSLPFAPCYLAVGSALPTAWALFAHHFWLGILALAGAGSHLALWASRRGWRAIHNREQIFDLRVDLAALQPAWLSLSHVITLAPLTYSNRAVPAPLHSSSVPVPAPLHDSSVPYRLIRPAGAPPSLLLFGQRDALIGHLAWVSAFLGAHSVGALIHNDSAEALGRSDSSLSDIGFPMRPMILTAPAATLATDSVSSLSGSADCLICHVDSFCLHTAVLVVVKGVLVSRSSRLVSAKGVLGFTYPCDGPGRGGTCQISPWDHVFLGAFWAYNTGSVGPFHFLWYAQSVLWAQLDDWAVSASSINGWLASLLWTESAKVMQAYGTPFCGYSLVFLTGHFVWALSLMFLFTGRGYWQELVESLAWAHVKLHLVPAIQPRALSITTGRAVGLTHYLAGSIGASWAFSTCRLV